jgi:hypothetical protein
MAPPPQSTAIPLAMMQLPGTQLYVRDSEGNFQPYQNTGMQTAGRQQSASTAKQLSQRGISSGTPIEWDGWPDSNWERDYSWEEVKATKHLQVHWATKTIGGDRRGDEFGLLWRYGKRSTRRCLGVINCDNSACKRIIRPQTTPRGIAKQLSHRCECGAIRGNPTTGPLGLMLGRRGLGRCKLKRGTTVKADSFIHGYAQFTRDQ